MNPFPNRARELKTWVSQAAGPEASIEALLSVTPYFRITARRAKAILREVEHAVGNWRKLGRTLGMTDRDLEMFAEAFEHPERKAARKALR